MSNINVTIDGKKYEVPEGITVLEACKQAGINIPVLCYHPDLREVGSCRVCVVDIEGQRLFQPSCAFRVWDGMVVNTNSKEVREARRMAVELMLSRHPQDCLKCERNTSCELQELAADFGMTDVYFSNQLPAKKKEEESGIIVREHEKCINCGRCLRACQEVQTVNALEFNGRGYEKMAVPTGDKKLHETTCTYCGQCVNVCPTGALHEKDETGKVWEWIEDPDTHVVIQTAPAIRVSIGEELGLEHGYLSTEKMVAAIRKLGFDKVFDTDFTADLTIMEEGHELLERVNKLLGGDKDVALPMITSCSPGWIKFMETFYPDLIPNVSTCKSPQQMFGALAKTYYPEKEKLDASKIKVVSIMPCTAKKYECNRPEMNSSGYQDVDVVLTTRELGKMMKVAGVDFEQTEGEKFDDPFGITTGAAAIFGSTGGVMEAALRTVYEVVTKEELPSIDLKMCRGMEGVKEATVQVGDLPVKVAVTNGLSNARKVLDKIRAGEADYHFIEIMCCPSGCIGGGGQPRPTSPEKRQARMDAIYCEDSNMELRKSHESPAIKTIYKEFLEKPLGEKSHKLLHTHYTKREWNI
ncbi:MAG: NADH-dependent [FeFe] hydrogenase, group A6 [Candidatus Muiribacteriota bacterium]